MQHLQTYYSSLIDEITLQCVVIIVANVFCGIHMFYYIMMLFLVCLCGRNENKTLEFELENYELRYINEIIADM